MIVDCFTFGWELDLLECRLIELNDVVDWFVICESKTTFQGDEKPLVFQENSVRFSAWADKIIYVIAELPQGVSPWQREYAQRDAMNKTLERFPSDAIILNGDVDEIPYPSVLANLPTTNPWVINYEFHSMAVDWKVPYKIPCTVVATQERAIEWGMSGMRRQRLSLPCHEGGWHFTWLGGAEMIAKKAAAFSHTEDSVQNYVKEMGGRLYTEGYHVLGEKLTPVEVDETFPRYIRERKCPTSWFRPR